MYFDSKEEYNKPTFIDKQIEAQRMGNMLFSGMKKKWLKMTAIVTLGMFVMGSTSLSTVFSEEAAVVTEAAEAVENSETAETSELAAATEGMESTEPAANEMNPEDILWPEIEDDILEGKDVVNILLIGQDTRDPNSRQRSDTMILATINKEKNKISITSFMRDLYVQIPGYGDNRINAAYPMGGMELLDNVIETNFGVKIDGNIEVDFSGFQEIIDMLGGVEIELSQAEADYICGRNRSALYTQPYREDWQYLTEGVNLLTGEQALVHARNRSIGNNDYERTERQREVLLACFNKVKEADVITLLKLVDDAFDMIETDLTYGEMLGYAKNLLEMGFDSLESYRIPQDGAFRDATISGMMVLVPDLSMCRSYLAENL